MARFWFPVDEKIPNILLCVLNQVFHYIPEQRVTEAKLVCKIGVRERYQ